MYGRIRRTRIRRCATSILVEPALFSTWSSAFIKLRDIGSFSAFGRVSIDVKCGPREDAHAKTTTPELCCAAKRAGADFIAACAALEVGELLKKQEV